MVGEVVDSVLTFRAIIFFVEELYLKFFDPFLIGSWLSLYFNYFILIDFEVFDLFVLEFFDNFEKFFFFLLNLIYFIFLSFNFFEQPCMLFPLLLDYQLQLSSSDLVQILDLFEFWNAIHRVANLLLIVLLQSDHGLLAGLHGLFKFISLKNSSLASINQFYLLLINRSDLFIELIFNFFMTGYELPDRSLLFIEKIRGLPQRLSQFLLFIFELLNF